MLSNPVQRTVLVDPRASCGPTAALTWALELKVWRDGRKDPLPEGLRQLDGYLDRLGRLDTGVLILFDRRKDAPPLEDRVREEQATSPKGRPIRILRA